jgi:hypothetical protein
MEEIITLDQAKLSRRDTSAHEDDALQLYLDQAHALVLDYVKQRRDDDEAWALTVDGWTDVTAPLQVQAAIIRMFIHLQRFRGDDAPQDTPKLEQGYLPADVTMLLYRLRDPALA